MSKSRATTKKGNMRMAEVPFLCPPDDLVFSLLFVMAMETDADCCARRRRSYGWCWMRM